jgi:hypothetical protein
MNDRRQWMQLVPIALGVLLLAVGLNANRIGEWLMNPRGPETAEPVHKDYTHQLPRGLSIRSGAFPEIDLIRFESCRIRKQNVGGFSLGAFNVLVIDQLEVVLPSPSGRPAKGNAGRVRLDQQAAYDVMGQTFRNMLATYPGFSKLEINGLSISIMGWPHANSANEVVNVLSAETAKSGRSKSLNLSGCGFVTPAGKHIECGDATLALARPWRITTGSGSFRVAGFDGRLDRALAKWMDM